MDHPKLEEDPVILEIREIREKLRRQTKGMSSEELSRWYREQARLVEERRYNKPAEGVPSGTEA